MCAEDVLHNQDGGRPAPSPFRQLVRSHARSIHRPSVAGLSSHLSAALGSVPSPAVSGVSPLPRRGITRWPDSATHISIHETVCSHPSLTKRSKPTLAVCTQHSITSLRIPTGLRSTPWHHSIRRSVRPDLSCKPSRACGVCQFTALPLLSVVSQCLDGMSSAWGSARVRIRIGSYTTTNDGPILNHGPRKTAGLSGDSLRCPFLNGEPIGF